MAESAAFPPPKLELGTNPVDDWITFRQVYENYEVLADMKAKQKKYQSAVFLHCVGSRGMRIYNNLDFAPAGPDGVPAAEDREDVDLLIKKFQAHIVGEINETYERYKFNKRAQNQDESIDDYVSSLKELAKTCNFCDCLRDTLVRDKIVLGVTENSTRKVLLQRRNLTLRETVDICRGAEATRSQLRNIGSSDTAKEAVNRLKFKRPTDANKDRDRPRTKLVGQEPRGRHVDLIDCLFCGKKHECRKSKCPAFGKTCAKCGKKNHFAVKCQMRSGTKIHTVEYDSDKSSDTDDLTEHAYKVTDVSDVNKVKNRKEVFAEMLMGEKKVRFQIDTGATVNLMPLKYVKDVELRNTEASLHMWNNSVVKPQGLCVVKIRNPKTRKKYKVDFIVVKEDLTPVLGKKVSEKMGLITVNYDNFKVASVKATERFADIFEEGKLGTLPGRPVGLVIQDGAVPQILPARRVPIALGGRVQEELDRLTNLGVIRKVDEPTDWVNQMAVQEKKSGDLRICLDPRLLNEVLKRERYMLPTLEEVLPKLSGAKVFSQLDVASAYWHVELNKESSLMTTFATPYGRYRWVRLPFGLSVSSEIFQKRLNQALEGLEGVVCVADDCLVLGVGETQKEAEESHEKNLDAFLNRCREKGIVLNKKKTEISQKRASFLGHIITSEGVKADPEKVQGIAELTRPTNREEVRILQGTVNYLSKFLPRLSQVMEPIRQLTRDGVVFQWGEAQERAFEKVKSLVTKAPILAYYSPNEELVLQTDASNKGLGAALLQNGKPIAYKSRALSDTESRYAPIEKEMLSVVWGLEKFHQYTYGRKVVVHNDHKPLEVIVRKSLSKAPHRLQNMLLRAMNYDYEIVWKKGKDQVVADMLSRAAPPGSAEAAEDGDFAKVNSCSYLSMGPERVERLKKETERDEVLEVLKSVIMMGWPEDKSKAPSLVSPYFSFADELTVQDGVIFKGERVVIPCSMRGEMKRSIHESHLGVTGCTRRARESIFWPGMTSEIKQFIQTCETCRRYEISNQKETMMPHQIPERPWEKVGVDIFELEGVYYVVTVDYFSNFWEVDRLEDTTSVTIIRKLKAHFARYGIPRTLVSDNAPNLTSEKFCQFMREWDIQHVTSAPHHPAANGMAESAVKTAKSLLRKCKESRDDEYLAVLNHRNTPSNSIDESPAQRALNRRTRTLLPTSLSLLQTRYGGIDKMRKKLRKKSEKQTEYYNRGAKDLSVLEEGETVRMKPHVLGHKVWRKGVVMRRLDERSYEIQEENGNIMRRNRVHLKPTEEPVVEQRGEEKECELIVETHGLQGLNTADEGKRAESPELKSAANTKTRYGRQVKRPGYLKEFVWESHGWLSLSHIKYRIQDK